MNIIVAHATGFSVDNDSTIKDEFIPNKNGGADINRSIHPKHLYDVKSTPSDNVQVLCDNGKGYFCIFESNRKIKIVKDMSNEEVEQLKHNLKKWQ